MKNYSIDKIRNIGIIGHGGCGKTSLAEAMLYDSGEIDRLGRVRDGNTVFDFDQDEISRQLSISSAIGYCIWNNYKINIIDTPGYANFIGDTEGCMRVMDAVVVVINSEDSVQVQTEKVWGWADELGLPRIVFVNKMDAGRANLIKVFDDIKKIFSQHPIKLHLPIGEGENFKGIIDLMEMKTIYYNENDGRTFNIKEIPPDLKEKALEHREQLVECIVETDDSLTERFLKGDDISNDELILGLRQATIKRLVIPVMCGSAIKNIGIHPLVDGIVSFLPSPQDMPPILVTHTTNGERLELTPSENAFSAIVFKTIADPYSGRLSLLRVYSGQINADSSFLNATKDIKERFGHIFVLQGKRHIPVDSISAGDFGAIPKLKSTITGDTVTDEKFPIVFEPIRFPNPVISFAIQPKTKADEEKVSSSLARLVEEDQTLHISRDQQTKELLLSGMGQEHIEVIVERLKRKFGVEVEIKTPRVPYKETIKTKVKVQGKYKRQSGGRGQYGDVWIELSPLPRGKGFEFIDNIIGGAIPRQYIPAVEKGIIEAMSKGVVAGYPVVDVKVVLYDGSFHEVDSSEMAFKIAGSLAFKKGFVQCRPILLEPIMNVDVNAPEEYIGSIIGDINSKRGKIVGIDTKSNLQIIKAHIPMVEILKYVAELRSITGGRGAFTMGFYSYEEVPGHIAEKIIGQYKLEHGMEEEV